MLKNLLKGFVALAALIGLTGVLSAKNISSNELTAGPRAAYSVPKDANSGVWSGGAQARLGLLPSLKLEGSIDYRRNDFADTRVSVYPLQASLLIYLSPDSMASPILLGGVGLYYTKITGPLNFNNTTSRFGTHLGAGLEVMLNEELSFDAGYRQIWVEKITSINTSAIDKQYDDNGYVVTVGLNLVF